MRRLTSGLAPALFWLAPLVGEFGVGNLRVGQLYVLAMFVPLYDVVPVSVGFAPARARCPEKVLSRSRYSSAV